MSQWLFVRCITFAEQATNKSNLKYKWIWGKYVRSNRKVCSNFPCFRSGGWSCFCRVESSRKPVTAKRRAITVSRTVKDHQNRSDSVAWFMSPAIALSVFLFVCPLPLHICTISVLCLSTCLNVKLGEVKPDDCNVCSVSLVAISSAFLNLF